MQKGENYMRRTRKLTPFGMMIRMEMFQQNVTVKELAERIGKSEATVCDVIAGANNKERTRELIIEELGIKVG